ncbi:MAG: hypothetical protein WBQ86_21510, partial [Candidatus Binatus sp.]
MKNFDIRVEIRMPPQWLAQAFSSDRRRKKARVRTIAWVNSIRVSASGAAFRPPFFQVCIGNIVARLD